MVQGGKANQWIHVLLPALLAALRALGDAPSRSLTALAQRLDVRPTNFQRRLSGYKFNAII